MKRHIPKFLVIFIVLAVGFAALFHGQWVPAIAFFGFAIFVGWKSWGANTKNDKGNDWS